MKKNRKDKNNANWAWVGKYVAEYAAPPDVYSLCLTCTTWHTQQEGEKKLIATAMLRSSLLSSLSRVLKGHGLSPEVFSFVSMGDGMSGRVPVLLSGSTMVQTVLGEDYYYLRRPRKCVDLFDPSKLSALLKGSQEGLQVAQYTDIDIFVAPAAASTVRTHLVSQGMMLNGLSDSCACGYGDVPIHGNLRSDIHHVEAWGNTEENARLFIQREIEDAEDNDFYGENDFWGWNSDEQRKMTSEEIEEHMPAYMEEFIAEANQFGGEINEFFMSQYESTPPTSQIPYIRKSKDHEIRVLPQANGDKGDLPFNYRTYAKQVDLVVGETGCVDARSLLESSDLSICTASWDGTIFRIPQPHLTFNRKAVLDPARLKVMQKYMEVVLAADSVYQAQAVLNDRYTRLNRVLAVYDPTKTDKSTKAQYAEPHGIAVRFLAKSIMQLPCVKLPDPAIAIPLDGQAEEQAERGDGELSLIKYAKFIGKLFKRIQKYTDRGINVVNAPAHLISFAGRFDYFTGGGPFIYEGCWWDHMRDAFKERATEISLRLE